LSAVFAAAENVTVSATVPAICGNGIMEGSEQCDDGNTSNGDGCSSSCTTEESSGGGPQPPEPPPTALCGNGVVETSETCDDGNQMSGDGCSGACQLEGQSPAICGNGIMEGSEQCDDGNTSNGDGCSASCVFEIGPACGNTILESGEQCEDGNSANGDGCSDMCQIEFPPSICGNGIIEGAEQCEDGNSANGDGCSASCVIEAGPACGNGIIEGAEQCDDGNLSNGDGCSSSCEAEIIFGPMCGNGLVETGEQCDDNNTTSGDGCSSVCQSEVPGTPGEPGTPGGPGSGSTFMCGNAILETGEQCDDGNTLNNDGCSSLCQDEAPAESFQETIDDIQEIFAGEGSFAEKVLQTIGFVGRQITDGIAPAIVRQTEDAVQAIWEGAQKINELADNPEVERVTREIVAPSVIITTVVAIAPSLFHIIFPLLRFLFLQPILIFGRRKRKEWGMVYNALDKQPIDLAIIRLINAETGTVVRSRVTDKEGRYLFSVPAGKYHLEVTKKGFDFPSNLLKQVSADGQLLDIYHGEPIVVTEEGARITPNIPLDPQGVAPKTPSRIVWEKRLRVFQHIISVGGIAATVVLLYINPSWEIWIFLGVHILLYILFLRFVKPKEPKDWGIVYDVTDKAPIGRAVARLFSKQYNKLVATKITDTHGRYSFLAGPNDYYVTVEKPGYETITREVSIKNNEEVISESVGIEKLNEAKKQGNSLPPSVQKEVKKDGVPGTLSQPDQTAEQVKKESEISELDK
jgi:cysteine-rich repeat protein